MPEIIPFAENAKNRRGRPTALYVQQKMAAVLSAAREQFVAMVLAEIDRAILLAQPIPTSREIAEHAEFVTNIFWFGCLGRQ